MKIISTFFIFALLLNINCIAQNKKNGYYKSFYDFKKSILTIEEDMDWIGQTEWFEVGPYFVHFTNKQKKQKIKGNPNWGCRISGTDYKFYKGKPYEIIMHGKIMLYRIGDFSRYYYSKGNHEIVTRIININEDLGYYLFSDDPPVLGEYNMKIGNVGYTPRSRNFLIFKTCIEKYNVRNK